MEYKICKSKVCGFLLRSGAINNWRELHFQWLKLENWDKVFSSKKVYRCTK